MRATGWRGAADDEAPEGAAGRVSRVAFLGGKGLPSKGGVERVVEAIAGRLAGRHEVTVYCDMRYTPPGITVPGVRLVRIPSAPGKHAQASSYFALSALHAVLFGTFDVVHLHSVETAFVLPLLRLRFPVVATAHGSPTRSTREKWGRAARLLMGATERPFLALPDVVTSVSDVDAEYMERRYGRRPVYIPNGVDLDEGAGASPHGSKELPDEFVLFAAGRIDPTKGCHLVVDAMTKVETELPLLVVGDLEQVPDYGRSLRVAADERVEFRGHVADRRRLFGLLAACRLFVFPSLTEGMSMMLLEAAGVGAPLVCSDIPENVAVLGERALYFRSGDSRDLAEKIAWALGHPAEMAERAALAREWVLAEYSWDRIVGEYEALYARALARRPRRWRRRR